MLLVYCYCYNVVVLLFCCRCIVLSIYTLI
nr:MAG TPA_asm: hypothetical protein [Caudoviricetes sp.]